MEEKQPYLNYKFTGIKPLRNFLDEAGIENEIINREDTLKLKQEREDLFTHPQDSIVLGKSRRDGLVLYYIEFRIVLDEMMFSHFSFIFDREPSYPEMIEAAESLEGVVLSQLASVSQDIKNIIN